MYTLLLIKLAAEGLAIKPRSSTSLEYAEEYPQLKGFADAYTRLTYKVNLTDEEREAEFDRIRGEYLGAAEVTRRKGFSGFIKRVFSLRDLKY